MNDFHLIYRNLLRKKLRAGLMMVVIFIAFLIFGVLVGFLDVVDSATNVSIENERLMTVNKVNFTQPLPVAYVNKIRAIEGVSTASYASWYGGYFRDPRDVIPTFAVEPETYLAVGLDQFSVPPDQREAWFHDRMGLLVGKDTADKYGWKLGDSVPLASNIYQRTDGSHVWNFVIRAIYTAGKGASQSGILMNYEYFNEARTFGKDSVNFIVYLAEDPKLNDAILHKVDETFANSSAPTRSMTSSAFTKSFLAQQGNINLIITSVVSAAFASILLVVGNTMAMAIRERTREIAVMKTIGFPRLRIFRLVLSETILLSVAGGILGLAAAQFILRLLGKLAAGNLPSGMAITPHLAAEALAIMLALGLLTGLIPALNAMRLNVVAGLGRS